MPCGAGTGHPGAEGPRGRFQQGHPAAPLLPPGVWGQREGQEGTPNRAAAPGGDRRLRSPPGEHQRHYPHTPAPWSCWGSWCALINTPTRNNCCSFVALETSSCQQSRGPTAPCLRELLSPKSPCTWQSHQQRTIWGFCPIAGQTGSGSASPLAFKCATGGASGSRTLNVQP